HPRVQSSFSCELDQFAIRTMSYVRTRKRQRVIFDRCLSRYGVSRIGIVSSNYFYFDSRIVDFFEYFPNALFWRIVEYSQAQKIERQVLLFFGEISAIEERTR